MNTKSIHTTPSTFIKTVFRKIICSRLSSIRKTFMPKNLLHNISPKLVLSKEILLILFMNTLSGVFSQEMPKFQVHAGEKTITLSLSDTTTHILTFPEYMEEHPLVHFTLPDDISLQSSDYSSDWPPIFTFTLSYQNDLFPFEIRLQHEPYLKQLFKESFDFSNPSGSILSSTVLESSPTIKSAINVYGAGQKARIGSSSKDGTLSLHLGNIFVPGILFYVEFDLRFLNPQKNTKLHVTAQTKQTLEAAVCPTDTFMHTYRLSYRTTAFGFPLVFNTENYGGCVIDNISILLPCIPMTSTFEYKNEFFNEQIIAIHPGGYFARTVTTKNVFKGVNFFINRNESGSFYSNGIDQIEGAVRVDVAMNPDEWYFLSFPFDISRITINGKTALNEQDLRVKYYDSNLRAHFPDSAHFQHLIPQESLLPFTAIRRNKGNIYALHRGRYPNGAHVVFHASTETKFRVVNTLPVNVSIPIDSDDTVLPENRSISLIGNPYPCYYLPNEDQITLTYNGDTYLYDHPEGIRPFQAFFVQPPTTPFQFYPNNRFYPTAATAKAAFLQNKQVAEFIRLQFRIQKEHRCDFTDIRLREHATEQFDPGMDFLKMKSPNPITPQLFSVSKEQSYMINTIPEKKEPFTVHLTIEAKESGEHTLSLTSYSNVSAFEKIRCGDTDLLHNERTFLLQKGERLSFEIHLFPASVTTHSFIKEEKSAFTNVYHENGIAYFTSVSPGKVEIFTLQGVRIYNNSIESDQPLALSSVLPLSPLKEVYILHWQGEQGTERHKIRF